MTEFTARSDHRFARRERTVRLVLWGAVLALTGITLFAVYGTRSASPQLKVRLAWLAVLIVAGSVVAMYVFVFRRGIDMARRGLVFELTEKELVRRRTGWPDVRIRLSEIRALHEGRAGLVVARDVPPGKIAIPKAVDGYEELRAELAKHCLVTVVPSHSVLAFGLLVISLFCWGLALWSKNREVAEVAAVSALLIMARESIGLVRSVSGMPKRHLVWTILGVNWCAALVVLYFRAKRGW